MTSEVGYGKPPKHSQFKKGDPRINRDGRPKDSVSLSALFRRIGNEPAVKRNGQPMLDPNGKPMTNVEVLARSMMQTPKQQGEFLDRGWGKAQQQQQDVVNWTPDEWRKEAASRAAQVSETLETFDDASPDE